MLQYLRVSGILVAVTWVLLGVCCSLWQVLYYFQTFLATWAIVRVASSPLILRSEYPDF